MDIQAEKLSLIEWIAGIDDSRIIKQFKSLQQSNQEQANDSFSSEEESAIDQGLKSITEGKVHTHDSVIQSTKSKYPQLFK
jgi:predicted transcriptional regulator